jgi:type 1 glutamine amidotransferase
METGGGAGMAGGGGGDTGPYAPRTGSFKMLVYSQVCCGAYDHPSRPAGRSMLQAIGQKQGFEVVLATNESEINPEGLAQYEIVFFLNSTGDLWQSGNLRRDYETWIRNNGAYAGMHGATDSASSWSFYKELTGQYYDVHDNGVVSGTIQWTNDGLSHVVGAGLPNPWNRQEEWYRFNSWQTWSQKPGFTVLNTVTTTSGGTRPVSYVREWDNIRAFYTSLGHADAPYSDATVIKHVTAGIMWAVRREALIVP